VFALW